MSDDLLIATKIAAMIAVKIAAKIAVEIPAKIVVTEIAVTTAMIAVVVVDD